MMPTTKGSGLVDASWQEFPHFLRRIRTRQGLSQEKLAAILGCGREHIWRLEHGQRVPSRQLLFLLARSCPLTETEKKSALDFARLGDHLGPIDTGRETPGTWF